MSYLLGSAVDERAEYANQAAFPVTGASDRQYVDVSTGKLFRWTGTVYVEESRDLTVTVATIATLPDPTTSAAAYSGCADVVTVLADGTGGQFRKDAAVLTGDGAMTQPGWRRIVGDHIDVRWFGARGDAQFRKLSDGTWWQDAALTIPASNNTPAFKAAYDWCLTQGGSAYDMSAPNTITFGFQTRKSALYIPGGGWYCDAATDMFTSSRVPFGGSRTAIRVRGDGKWNTIIHLRQVAPAVNDYVIRLDLFEPIFEDIMFQGATKSEQIFDYSFAALSQNLMMRNIGIRQFKTAFRVTGTNGNCDKTTWVNTAIWTDTPGASFFLNETVTQSVAHTFVGGDHYIGGAGSAAFRLIAGGATSIHGGSWEIHTGATLCKITGTSAQVGGQIVPNLTWLGAKFECHDNSCMTDLTGGAIVQYVSCGQTVNVNNAGNPKHVIREFGQVVFVDSNLFEFGPGVLAATIVDAAAYAQAGKPRFMFERCILPTDFLSTALRVFDATQAFDPSLAVPGIVYAGVNTGGLPTVTATQCSHNHSGSISSGVIFAANGTINHVAGCNPNGAQTNVMAHVGYPNPVAGLPSTAVVNGGTVKLPIGCFLRAVRICKSGPNLAGAGASQGWVIKDGNNLVLSTLQLTGDQIKTEVTHLGKMMTTDAERSLTIAPLATNTNHYAQGFFEVEWS